MNSLLITGISVLYLLILFYLAFLAERNKGKDNSLTNNSIVFSLSLAIYCSAWTFYGNVEGVSKSGLKFLPIYLGSTLVMILGWTVLRKIVRISRVNSITSIADFVSARYGKDKSLGVIISLISLLAGIPYIGLQIKAISGSFVTLTGVPNEGLFFQDPSFYIALILIVFTILFGTRKILPDERHEGMIFSVAAESVYKLLALLLVGFLVTFFWNNGFNDVFEKYYAPLQSVFEIETTGYGTWFMYMVIAAFAFILLPRQFQVAVVENQKEENLKQAIWILPLYLLLSTVFVIPLALVGSGLLTTQTEVENMVIALSLHFSSEGVALLVYLGGFSAATGMIIVESIAISTMVTNSVLLPLLLKSDSFQSKFKFRILNIALWLRRVTIVIIVLFAYVYFTIVPHGHSLVSLGLISFVAVAQFAPAVLGGIYFKTLNKKGIIYGLTFGIMVWVFGLVIPYVFPHLIESFAGLYNMFSGFEISSFDRISNIGFWSLFLNISTAFVISSLIEPNSVESKQALLFVDVFKYSDKEGQSVFWKGTAKNKNLEALLSSFLGRRRSTQILESFAKRNKLNLKDEAADGALVSYVENTISQYVGTSTASMLVSSITKEEVVTVEEVLEVLKRSEQVVEHNKELHYQKVQLEKLSDELSQANEKLKDIDAQKDDFIRTVTHEFRTPLTAIRALTEIIYDNEDMENEQKGRFLETIIAETDRLSRMVNEILDIEKYESGKHILNGTDIELSFLAETIANRLGELAKEKSVSLDFTTSAGTVFGDEDKLVQMLINLVSNSIKFVSENGKVEVSIENTFESTNFEIRDNGVGIPADKLTKVFEKFFQIENRSKNATKGSGLGLPIVKKIVDLHEGTIRVSSEEGEGTLVIVTLPRSKKEE